MKKQKIAVVGLILTVEYPAIGKKFVADLSKFPQSIRQDAMIHGFKQKFGDAESGGTAAEKFAMVQRINENLMSGSWDLVSTPDNTPAILEAVARVKGSTVEKLEKALQTTGKKDLEGSADFTEYRLKKVKDWGTNGEVKAALAEIKAEKAKKAASESTEKLVIPGIDA